MYSKELMQWFATRIKFEFDNLNIEFTTGFTITPFSWRTENFLSNDPGKKGSNLFCCGAIRFPHIEMFSFLRRECINLQKGCLRKKMYLNSTFKGCIFVLKHFDQSQELQTMAKKCSQFYMIRTYDFCVT